MLRATLITRTEPLGSGNTFRTKRSDVGWPAPTRHTRSTVTEGLGRALARPTQPVHRPWSPSGRRRGSEVPVPRPRAWRSAAARLPAAAAGWAKSINPLLRHEVEGVHRLGSRGYQTGPSEPQVTTRGRATCTKWLMSKHTSTGATM